MRWAWRRWRGSAPRWTGSSVTPATPKARWASGWTSSPSRPRSSIRIPIEGRAQILADYEAIIDEMTAGLDPYFGIKPKAGSWSSARAAVRGKDRAGRLLQPAAARRLAARHVLRQPARCRARRPSTACARWPITRPCPATICRSRSRRKSRDCRSFAASSPFTAYMRGLGAVCRTARVGGGLREGPARQPRPPAGRDVPRRAARRRHRPAQQALDARAGDRLHGREHRHARGRRRRRDRAVPRQSRSGAGVQGGHAQDPGVARAREDRVGRQVRPPRISRRSPEERRRCRWPCWSASSTRMWPARRRCPLRSSLRPARSQAARNPRSTASRRARRDRCRRGASAASSQIADSALRIVLRRWPNAAATTRPNSAASAMRGFASRRAERGARPPNRPSAPAGTRPRARRRAASRGTAPAASR